MSTVQVSDPTPVFCYDVKRSEWDGQMRELVERFAYVAPIVFE